MSYRSLVFAFATFALVPAASAHAQSVYVAPTICLTNAPYTIVDQYYGYWGAVLNIRAWPNGAILGVLANGIPVQILNVDASNGSPWAYVALANGSAGWVFLPYLYCGG
jgi:hypothetical protein